MNTIDEFAGLEPPGVGSLDCSDLPDDAPVIELAYTETGEVLQDGINAARDAAKEMQ